MLLPSEVNFKPTFSFTENLILEMLKYSLYKVINWKTGICPSSVPSSLLICLEPIREEKSCKYKVIKFLEK